MTNIVRSFVFAVCITLLAPVCVAQGSPDSKETPQASYPRLNESERKELLDKAKKSYATMPGFPGFRSKVQVDFDAMYKGLNTDKAVVARLLPLLQKVTFEVVVGRSGASTVSHQSNVAPPDTDTGDRLRISINGAEQVIDGFLQSWAPFAIKTPLEDVSKDDEIEDSGSQYRITHKERNGKVIVHMLRNYQVETFEIALSDLNATLHPVWESTPKGWRLAGYDITYRTPEGKSQQVSSTVQYQEVEGFAIPSQVTASAPIPQGLAKFPLSFVEPQILKQ